jgi:hypothetical protein
MTSSAIAKTGLKAYWSGVLGQPWIDRPIAIIASVPFVWLVRYRYQHLRLGLPLGRDSYTQLTIALRGKCS